MSDPTEVAYFACGGPPATTLRQLVLVVGARWAIEDLFELAKGDCGLDGYEVGGVDRLAPARDVEPVGAGRGGGHPLAGVASAAEKGAGG